MSFLRGRRLAVLAGAAAAAAAMIVPAASQASVQPNFTCSNTQICFWSEANLKGNDYPFDYTYFKLGKIYDLRDTIPTVPIPWGSVNNADGNESYKLINESTGKSTCLGEGEKDKNPGAIGEYAHIERFAGPNCA